MLLKFHPSLSAFFFIFLGAWTAHGDVAAPTGSSGNAKLGMNIAGPSDSSTELPWFDVFRTSRPWISQQKDKGWGQGPKLDLDEHGWVKRLEPDCWIDTVMCTMEGGHYPSGNYTVLYQGKGKIAFQNVTQVVKEEPGRIVVNRDSSQGAFFLKILETNPDDYIRNVRVIMPGGLDVYEKNPWRPEFLARWKGVAALRFMDMMQTNHSKVREWADRPTLESATFMNGGVPLEALIDLANRLHADPWFCIPIEASDDYVRHFASMVKERLDPELKAYVEYSNEIWNSGFSQHHFAGKRGQELGLAEKPWEAAWKYTGHRSAEIFAICTSVSGNEQRWVRVLASQAASTWVSERILDVEAAAKSADALAIGPYITFCIDTKQKPTADEVAAWTVEQLLDHVEKVCLPMAITWMREQKAVADKHGLKLIAYEGGQHLVGVMDAVHNDKLTRLLLQANAHPRMGELYRRYFDEWTRLGGGLFCHYASVGSWSKWGSWGLLQYEDEKPGDSPKFVATMEWARKMGQAVGGGAL